MMSRSKTYICSLFLLCLSPAFTKGHSSIESYYFVVSKSRPCSLEARHRNTYANDDEYYGCSSCTNECSSCVTDYDTTSDTDPVAFLNAPEEYEQLVIQRHDNYLLVYTMVQSFYDGTWQYANNVSLYNLITHSWVFITLSEAYYLTHQMPPLPPQ